jgi:hypothetical protein
LLVDLFVEVTALKRVVGEQREEIARLKGLKGRPTIRPSGMDTATGSSKPGKKEKRRGRGKVTPRVSIDEQVLKVVVPPGSRFKGHEPFLVQDLVLSVRATCYQRERWVTPDGRTILAPLPEGTDGHFGPELRRFVLMQYHQGQSTLPRLLALLSSMGASISKRQVQRLLTEKHDDFITEAQMSRAPDWRLRPGCRWTTRARVMRERTAFARKSAMTGSPGSAREHRKAG